jgi:DNA polymerase-1
MKVNMKKLFARQKVLKNGNIGKTLEMPSLIELHTDPELLPKWVDYATLDAEATFFLREVLVREMLKYPTDYEGCVNIFDLYCQYWLPFGEILTDIERIGIRVNTDHLQKAELQAKKDIEDLKASFIDFVRETQEDAYEFNASSTQQL